MKNNMGEFDYGYGDYKNSQRFKETLDIGKDDRNKKDFDEMNNQNNFNTDKSNQNQKKIF